MIWKIIAIVASIIPVIIMVLLFNISPQDITKIGLVPFIFASMFAIAKLLTQGLRFHYYLKNFVGDVASVRKIVGVRIASEFVTLTTSSYIGGEFVRLAWMSKKKIHTGKGMWIVIIEIISDVLVGGILSYIAAAYALITQNYLIATIIIVAVTPIFVVYILLLVLSSKRIFKIPKIANTVLVKMVGYNKSERWINSINDMLEMLYITSKHNLNRGSLKIFIIGFLLTLLSFIFYALAFMILVNTSVIGLLESILGVAASTSIGAIPITLGGSGLTELGMSYYLTIFGLEPSTFSSAIIIWRIVTYHLLLIIGWVFLLNLIRSRQ